MKSAAFYKQDWFVALLIGIVFGIAILGGAQLLDRLEFIAYDAGVRLTHRPPGATDQIAIIEINDDSIQQIGRWPWPRSVHAAMLDYLAKDDARAIGMLIYLTEPQTDPGLTAIRDIRGKVEAMAVPRPAQTQFADIRMLLSQAEKTLDTDTVLAHTISGTP